MGWLHVVPESWMSARTAHSGIRKTRLQRRLLWLTGAVKKKQRKSVNIHGGMSRQGVKFGYPIMSGRP